jgi:hypothetical protein
VIQKANAIIDYPEKPAVQLISHLSEGAYTSFPKTIKELVNNSFDARATKVDLTFTGDFSTLTVSDNGIGISSDEFKSQFLRISGSQRRLHGGTDHTTGRPIIGRLGIGVLAIAPICEYAEIKSKRKGDSFGILRRIPLKHLFDVNNKLKNLEELYYFECLPDFRDEKEKQYTNITLFNLRHDIREEFQRGPTNGTKGWKSVSQLDGLTSFSWHLGLLIPIKYADYFPIYKINNDRFKNLHKELSSFDFKVFINGQELRKPICLGGLYFKECFWNYEKKKVPREEFDVKIIESREVSKVKYWGYVYDQTKQIFPVDLRGILIRIRHVGIKGYSKSFFEYPTNIGPTMFSVSGEIYVESGLEEALTMDKDDFKEEHPDFREIVKDIHEAIKEVRQNARSRSAVIRKPTKETKKPRQKVKDLKFTNELTEIKKELGRDWVRFFPAKPELPLKTVVRDLRKRIELLSNVGVSPSEQDYLDEAVRCFESKCFRASIILCWTAGMDRIIKKIETIGLNKFDDAAKSLFQSRRFPWFSTAPKTCKDMDEFRKDVRDIQICATLYELDLLTQSYVDAMRMYLTIRNNCAHPSGYTPSDGEAIGCFTFILSNIFESSNFQ